MGCLLFCNFSQCVLTYSAIDTANSEFLSFCCISCLNRSCSSHASWCAPLCRVYQSPRFCASSRSLTWTSTFDYSVPGPQQRGICCSRDVLCFPCGEAEIIQWGMPWYCSRKETNAVDAMGVACGGGVFGVDKRWYYANNEWCARV